MYFDSQWNSSQINIEELSDYQLFTILITRRVNNFKVVTYLGSSFGYSFCNNLNISSSAASNSFFNSVSFDTS